MTETPEDREAVDGNREERAREEGETFSADDIRESVRLTLACPDMTDALFARMHGITRAKLSEFLGGKRGPESGIIERLGYRWVIVRDDQSGLPDTERPIKRQAENSILDADTKALVERLRSSAKAFRENPIYDSEGDGVYLTAQADELDAAALEIERLSARQPADAAPAMDGWRDIASYERKKNSSELILLWGRYWSDSQSWMREPLVGQWVPYSNRFEVFARVPFGVRPIVWMPLPAPPTDTVESGEKL